MRCISVKHMYMHYCICVQYSLYTGRKVEFPDVAYSGNVYGTSGNAKESAQYRAEFPGNSALFCMFPAAGNFIFAPVVYRNTGNRRARADGYQPISIQDDDDGVRVVSSGRRTSRRSEPSLVIALAKSFWPIFLAAAFFKVLQDLLNFVSPQLLK